MTLEIVNEESCIRQREKIEDYGVCKRCGIILTYGKRVQERDENWNRTGRQVCNKCYLKDWYRVIEKKRSNSKSNALKSVTNCRTNNQNPEHSDAKGDKAQKLTCKLFGIKDLNIENDNYRTPIDHSTHPELGILQTKSRRYDPYEQSWKFSHLDREWKKEINNMIFWCISNDGKNIERGYIIPKEEILKRTCVNIYKRPSRGGWYEQYRITNKETIKKANDIWKEIIRSD